MLFSSEEPLHLIESLPVTISRNQTQQLKVAGAQPRPGNGSPNPVASQPSLTVPQHVQSVQATLQRTSDISTKATITFKRNPSDPLFVETRVYVAGYKGNPQPVQVGSGQSPVSFSLENTGEPVTVTVQSSGNLGQAPISTAPSTTFQLAKTNLATTPTAGGNGTGSSSATLGLTNPFWCLLWDGSNYSFSNSGNGTFGTGTANQVKFTMIRVAYSIKLTTMVTRINVTSVGGVAACGIYDLSGNKLGSWDNFSVATGATVIVAKTGGGSITLAPGIYIAACACSDTSAAASLGGCQAGGSNEGIEPWNSNGTKRTGTAANAMSAGVMPATLGALSIGGAGLTTLPNILLEP